MLLEQVRPDVAKLIVLAELEGTAERRRAGLRRDRRARLPGSPRRRGEGHLDDADATDGRVFFDLGSGTGKGVLVAGLCRHFARAYGVEIGGGHGGIADVLVEDFKRRASALAAGVASLWTSAPRRATFPRGETGETVAVDARWLRLLQLRGRATRATMTRLSRPRERMRPGAVFVTVLCPLVSHKFDVIEEAEMAFSWGAVECLVHRRKADADADDARALEEAFADAFG